MQSEETKSTFVYPKYIWFDGELYEKQYDLSSGLPKDRFVAYEEDKTAFGEKYTISYYYKLADYCGDLSTKKKKCYITKSDLGGMKPEVFLEKHRVLEDDCNVGDKLEKNANNTVSLNINGGTVQFKRKKIDEKDIETLNKRGVICFVKLKKTLGNEYGKNIIESAFCLQSKIDPTQKLMWRDFSVHDEIKMDNWIDNCLEFNTQDDFDAFRNKWWNKHSGNDNNATNEHATQIQVGMKENDNNNLQNDIKDGIQEECHVETKNNINNNNIEIQNNNNAKPILEHYVVPVINKNNNAALQNNFYNQKIENNQFPIPPQANVTNYTNQPSYQRINNNITQKPNNIMPQPNNIMQQPIKNYPSQNIITTQPVPLLRPIYKPNYCYMLTPCYMLIPKYYRPSRSLYRNKTKTFNRGCYYQQRPTVVYNNTDATYSRKYYRPKRGLNGGI